MTNLPLGWADRHNTMTEHDMKLGGMHATKFSAKNSYSSHNNNSTTSASGGIYNNSDQVRQFYLNESQKQNDDGSSNNTSSKMGKNNVPDFWENRQKEKQLQAKQMGVFAKQSDRSSLNQNQQQQQPAETTTVQSTSGRETTYIDGHNDDNNDNDAPEPEVALIQIATHALDALAKSLSKKKKVVIPMEDRASFAKAVKQAMDVLSKQQS